MLVFAFLFIQMVFEVLSQEDGCWKNKELAKNAKILIGDTHSLDLDLLANGNDFEVKVTTEPQSTARVVQVSAPFKPFGNAIDLTVKFSKCTAYTDGIEENEYVFICDKNKILFLTFDKRNGDVTSQSISTLGTDIAELECHSLSTARTVKQVFVTCLNKTDMLIYRIDLGSSKQESYKHNLVVKQVAGQVLSNNLKLVIDEYKYDKKTSTLLYVYEDLAASQKVRFRIFKSIDNDVQNGGYYGSDKKDSISNLENGHLVGFYSDGSKLFIVTRNEQNENTLQRCLRSPIYSRYICDDKKKTKLPTGVGILKFEYYNTNHAISRIMKAYFVTDKQIIEGIFDPEESSYIKGAEHSIEGMNLKKVTDIFPVGDNLFLVGPTTDELDVIDGVIKYSKKIGGWNKYNYPNVKSGIALIRRDYYNSHVSGYFLVGESKTFFAKIEKNLLDVRTDSFPVKRMDESEPDPQDFASITITLTCTAMGKKSENLTFTLDTQLKINEGEKFTLPNITAYTGSKYIHIPTNGDDIAGNAPTLSSIDTTVEGVKLSFAHMNARNAVFEGDKIENFKHLRHIGFNVFCAYNEEKLVFFKCSKKTVKEIESFNCKDLLLSENLGGTKEDPVNTKRIFHKAFASSDFIWILTSNIYDGTSGPKVPAAAKTYLKVVEIADGQKPIDELVLDYYLLTGELRMLDSEILLVSYGIPKETQARTLNFLKFKFDGKAIPSKMSKIFETSQHFCAKEFSWAPRAKNIIYISSICDGTGIDDHIYETVIDYEEPHKSYINDTYVVSRSEDFRICAQNRLVNVIDYKLAVIYSFDSLSGQYSTFNLPFKSYGLSKIVRHTCDQENNILQVIGCNGDICKLLTYRADLAHVPNRRVHSVEQIDSKYQYVASTFNDTNDDTFTVLLGSSTEVIQTFQLEVDGPHIRFEADKSKQVGPVNITWQLSFPGPEKENNVSTTHTVDFITQQTEVKMALLDPKKGPSINGQLTDLEEFCYITGPFHSVQKSTVDKVILTDRITSSDLYKSIQKPFEDAVIYKNFIFGYKKIDAYTTISLHNTADMKDPISSIEKKRPSQIFTIQKVIGADTEIYFFAFIKGVDKKDELLSFYSKDSGKTFVQAHMILETHGYKTVDIIQGPGNSFIFGGFNNLFQYTIESFIFTIDGGKINAASPFIEKMRENIADFDILNMDNKTVILIAAQEYEKQAHLYKLEIQSGNSLTSVASQRISLTPNKDETHQGIAFHCDNGESSVSFRCVHSGKNAFSYMSQFDLLKEPNEYKEFISKGAVVHRLRNIVNLRPFKVDVSGQYLAFLAKNELVLGKGENRTISKLFEDPYVVLVYKLDSKAVATTEDEKSGLDPLTRDVYKVLVASDFNVKDPTALRNVDPRFFTTTEGFKKLAVNIGLEESSIRVFNLDGLKITTPAGMNAEFDIGFTGVDGKVYPTKSKAIFVGGAENDGKKPSGSSKTLMLIVICVIIAIVAIVVVGVIMTKKQQEGTAEDLNIDEVQRTMNQGDESKEGNYSKL